MLNINELPDLCLRTIFSKLDLCDLLQMDLVCPLWAEHQERICARLSTLTLLIGTVDPAERIASSYFTVKHADKLYNDDGSRMYSSQYGPNRTKLKYSSLDWQTVFKLASKMSSIAQLEFAIHWAPLEPTISQTIFLLERWAPSVRSLALWFFFTPEPGGHDRQLAQPYTRLLATLNQLPVLERLTVDTPTALFRGLTSSGHFPRLDGLFSRLREFNLDSSDSSLAIQPLCASYIEPAATQLARIGLGSCVVFNSDFDLHQFPIGLANKLVSCQVNLDARLDYESLAGFGRAIAPFSSVTTLQLGNIHLKVLLDTCVTLARAMPELAQLELCRVEFDEAPPLGSVDHLQYQHQLASVRVLALHVDETVDARALLTSRHWQWLFPRMQVLELHGYCYKLPTNQLVQPVHLDWRTTDNRAALLTIFAHCPSLRHVFTRYQLPLTMPEDPFVYELDRWALVAVEDQKKIEYLGTKYNDY